MPILDISFADFDTVCYSTQYNIQQLIKHAVGIVIQVNSNTGDISNVQGQISNIDGQLGDIRDLIEQLKGEISEGSGDVNSLTLQVNEIQRNLDKLQSDYNVFAYAVTQDITALGSRITALEQKVG